MKHESWYSRGPDALDKETHYLSMGNKKSLDNINASIIDDHLAQIIQDAHDEHHATVRLIVDEEQAKHHKNQQWLPKLTDSDIPVKTGCTPGTSVGSDWSIVHGEFMLEGQRSLTAKPSQNSNWKGSSAVATHVIFKTQECTLLVARMAIFSLLVIALLVAVVLFQGAEDAGLALSGQ
jgi:hypothetical protein